MGVEKQSNKSFKTLIIIAAMLTGLTIGIIVYDHTAQHNTYEQFVSTEVGYDINSILTSTAIQDTISNYGFTDECVFSINRDSYPYMTILVNEEGHEQLIMDIVLDGNNVVKVIVADDYGEDEPQGDEWYE